MLRPTAIAVQAQEDYTLRVTFDNGEIRQFDVKPYIRGEWYSELKDKKYFHTVFTNGYTVEWANGQDLCPDELYFSSTPLTKECACAAG